MEPDLPRGAQARAVWRSLSPAARAAALAAARSGVAPGDVGIAWAAAGYGRMVARRMRILWLLAPVAVTVVAVAVVVGLVVFRAPQWAVDVVLAAFLAGALGGLVVLSIVARRYQRLYSSGLVGIEASAAGVASGAPVPGHPGFGESAWTPVAGESEFTVPPVALMPPVAPAPPVRTDPAAAGVHEIPVRRARIVAYLGFLLGLALVLWLAVVGLWNSPRETPVFAAAVTAFTLLYTFVVLFVLYAAGPALREPVSARFTPDGWELPPLRMRGSWTDVRAIRVRPLAARGSTAGTPQLAAFRVVALIVDDPNQPIAHLGALRRRLLQPTIRRYGSAVTIVASPRRTIPVVELVRLLRSYTAAPVDWA
jgi:hypothetical protein